MTKNDSATAKCKKPDNFKSGSFFPTLNFLLQKANVSQAIDNKPALESERQTKRAAKFTSLIHIHSSTLK